MNCFKIGALGAHNLYRIPVASFLYSAFLDFALQYNIANENRLTLVDILIEKE
jgi:hypothetical protein